jgi:hypothetical protein
VASTLYDRATREEYSKEYKIWLEEIELYKKYSPELRSLALDIVRNAKLDKLSQEQI